MATLPLRFSLLRAAALCVAAIIAGCAVLPLRAQPAQAQSESPDRTLSPYFRIKTSAAAGADAPAGEHADPLPLKSTRVEAVIAGSFANVKVTQRYANAGAKPLEAIYVFPGSTRAAVHGLTMTVGERRIEATVKEKAEARRTYEAAKTTGKTASLLEQHRPNVFQMNVANILPGDDVTVELRYTELLLPTDGVYEFIYPGVVGPRYSNVAAANAPAEHAWIANPYLHQGEEDPASYELTVQLLGSMPLQDVLCQSHAARVTYRGAAEARIEVADTNSANRDFILHYRLSGPAVQSGLLLAQGETENFFLLTVQPPARPKPEEMPAREYIFILDVSGSMNGFPLNISKRLMADLLTSLRPQDTFNVILFAGSDQQVFPASVPASQENLAFAKWLIEGQNGGGGTELVPALQQALGTPKATGSSRTFLLITDGYVGVEASAFRLIRSRLGEANLFVFGIGSSVNRHLMESLARAGQGEPFIVTDPERAPEIASQFRKYVSTPVLTKVAVTFDGLETYEVEPISPPDLLAERPLVIFGKWRGALQGKVRVDGLTGKSAYSWQQDISTATRLPDAEGFARLWARSRIAQLSDQYDLTSTDDLKQAITQLGLRYNLLTKYTSFVAVDEVVRRKAPDLETIKQPLPMPAGVEDSAVGDPDVGAAPEPSTYALAAVGASVLALAYVARRRRANKAAQRAMP